MPRKHGPLRVTLEVIGSPADQRRALSDVLEIIRVHTGGRNAATANDIADGGCAASGGRAQAAAAPHTEA